MTAVHELSAVVRELHAGQREGNARLEAVEQVLRGHGRQLAEVNERLGRVEGRLETTLERLEGIGDLAVGHCRSLEERVAKLEARASETR